MVANENSLLSMVETVPVGSITNHPRNPRRGDIEMVAESLKQHKQFRPLVVQKSTGHVIAGNHTLKAAKQLGWTHVDIVKIDVNDKKARKIMLIDNKSSDAGSYDDRLLTEIIESLEGEIEGTGYNQEEVDSLLASVDRDLQQVSRETDTYLREGTAESDQEFGEMGDEIPGEPRVPTQREQYLDQRSSDQSEAASFRGAPITTTNAPEEVDKFRVKAETQAAMEIRERELYLGTDFWMIPELRDDMMVQDVPDDFMGWGGTEMLAKGGNWADNPGRWWMYNYSLGQTKQMPYDRTILAFNCVDEETETLSQRGWLGSDQLTTDDMVLSMEPETGDLRWSPVHEIVRKRFTGQMVRMTHPNIDALVTINHKWPLVDGRLVKTENLATSHTLRTMGNPEASNTFAYSDAFVELVGWAVTEGGYHRGKRTHSVTITQNPGGKADRIELALKRTGAKWSEHRSGKSCRAFIVTRDVANLIHEVAPGRVLDTTFINTLSADQRSLLIETMIDGDGWRSTPTTRQYCQKDRAHTDAFIHLCTLSGIPTTTVYREWETSPNGTPIWSECYIVTLKHRKTSQVNRIDMHGAMRDKRGGNRSTGSISNTVNEATEFYDGYVWCPRTDYGTAVFRRNGRVYVSGQTHDDKFEGWWDTPGYHLARMYSAGITKAVVPDFSFYDYTARVLHLNNVYRAQWLGRFFQECGLKVIPRFQFRDEHSFDHAILGIPHNPPILFVSSQNFKPSEYETKRTGITEKDAEKRWAWMMDRVCAEIKPGKLLLYGNEKRLNRLTTDYPLAYAKKGGKVQIVASYSDVRRRSGVFGRAEGLGGVSAGEKRRIRQEAREQAGVGAAPSREQYTEDDLADMDGAAMSEGSGE